MNLEEYKKWLEENSNKEERGALNVVETILEYHEEGRLYEEVELFPRYILTRDNERIEFDLLIKLKHKWSRRYDTMIGIEFKEYDIRKVIMQACRRREFVDYMYIATRSLLIDYPDLFTLAYFGIGWILYDEDFARMVILSKWRNPMFSFEQLIDRYVQTIVEEKIENKVKSITLDKFGVS